MNEIVSQFAIQGNVVEALFPLGGGLARALRGDAQAEGVHFQGLLCGYVRHALLLVAVHGNAAQFAHQYAQGPEEPFLLHQEVARKALGMAIEHAYDEVHVAGMRCQCNDVLLGEGFGDLLPVSHPSEQYFMVDVHVEIGKRKTENGKVKAGSGKVFGVFGVFGLLGVFRFNPTASS